MKLGFTDLKGDVYFNPEAAREVKETAPTEPRGRLSKHSEGSQDGS